MTTSTDLQAALGDATLVAMGDSASSGHAALAGTLRRMGVPVVLLTAARDGPVASSFDGRFFACSPADKARLVRKLKEEGARVAFIGYGGTDQWAMTCADVRIDSPALLAGFGMLPLSRAGEAA